MKPSIQEIVAAYSTETTVDYSAMTKEQLLEVIKSLQARVSSTKTVNELVIEMLLDSTLAECSNTDIADAIKALIPGSATTSKSVSSIRSVYNKAVLDKCLKEAPAMDAREFALYKATLEFDLAESGKLIKQRQ